MKKTIYKCGVGLLSVEKIECHIPNLDFTQTMYGVVCNSKFGDKYICTNPATTLCHGHNAWELEQYMLDKWIEQLNSFEEKEENKISVYSVDDFDENNEPVKEGI
jgi:hypothetical protein